MTYLLFISHKEDKPKFEIIYLHNYELEDACKELKKHIDQLKIVNPEINYSGALIPVQWIYEK